MSDLIRREDAIKTVIRMCSPICDWELEKQSYTDCVVAEINSLPSAEAVHKPDYSYEADMVRRLKESLSAEADDRLYIKVYADDEPSVKAEKLYQICGETQNREVAEWLKEYFPSAEPKTGEWIDCRKGCDYYANCSNCGMQIDVREQGGYPNYCPNCGARMKGADDE